MFFTLPNQFAMAVNPTTPAENINIANNFVKMHVVEKSNNIKKWNILEDENSPTVLTTNIKTRVIVMKPKSQRWSLMTRETPRNINIIVSQQVLS